MNRDYGRMIRKRRQEKGHSQKELAKKVRVTRGTVANWEKGEMPPYLEELVKYLSEAPEPHEPQGEEQSYQLSLPFSPPISLELRVSPQRADTIHFAIQWKNKAS